MLLLLRWALRFLTGSIWLLIFGGAITFWLLQKSLPDYNARLSLDGLSAPVEIIRDTANVPHIFGQSDEDVFFGLGFVHAQDRLWSMVMLRRTAQGRLSEIFGARTLKIDELMRRYDLYTLARQSVSAQDTKTLAALEAYAAGVNAWVLEVSQGGHGRGAPELYLFSDDIAPWVPADSLAVLKLLALQLTSKLQEEVLAARLSQAFDPARINDLLTTLDDDPVIALPDYASLVPDLLAPQNRAIRTAGGPLSPFPENVALAGASNVWVAAAKRTALGGTLFANDPHLGFTAPSLWYLARLELSSGGVIGATLPGMPVVVLGRSRQLGWGLTSSELDDQDVVLERLNPANPEEYAGPEGWRRFEARRTQIIVKGADPVALTLRWSMAGPIMPGDHYDLASVTPPGHVAALSWTGLSADDASMTASVGLMYAQDISEGLEVAADFVAPSQNLVLADAEGIAYQLVGVAPKRALGHPTQGRMPALGTDPASRWQGRFPYGDNLRVLNPPSGILGNTNNRITTAPFPRHISYSWGDSQRIKRWARLMQSRRIHTRESFIGAQLDNVSSAMRRILPLVGKDLWYTDAPADIGGRADQRQRALALLAAWNGEMNEHLPEPLIAAAWLRALQDMLIRDELGPLADELLHLRPDFLLRVFSDQDGAGVWCDIIQSEPVETCSQAASRALDAALIALGARHGPNPESWRWGDVHEAAHDHPALGETPILKWFVNIRQSLSGGDFTLQRGKTKGEGDNPYLAVSGGGYRGVYDFADPDSSVFILATGQSGNPLSRHYDDLSVRWRQGEYIPMSLDPGLARAGAVGITHLVPTAP